VIPVDADSRAATDALLAELPRGGRRATAWRRFLGSSQLRV
jgi:hypothetical protein